MSETTVTRARAALLKLNCALTGDVVVQRASGKILLIQRAKNPFKGYWALPGGFINPDEEIIDGARRELEEETAIKSKNPLLFIDSYTEPKRDPRGRVITFAYYLRVANNVVARAGDDAKELAWFSPMDIPNGNGGVNLAFDHYRIINEALNLHGID